MTSTADLVDVGSQAPEIALRDQHGQDVRLSDFRRGGPAGGERGRSVVVVFYPFAFSGICTGELCEIRDDIDAFQNDDVQVLAVSCDPMHSLRAFAQAEGYNFPLLSDFWPHGAAAKAYGVFDDQRGCALRGSFLVDREGVVRWAVRHGMGEPRVLDSYRQALAAA